MAAELGRNAGSSVGGAALAPRSHQGMEPIEVAKDAAIDLGQVR